MPLTITDVFRAVNKLKQRRVVRDWALIGSVAATLYVGPINTLDIDIMVLVDSDADWLEATRQFGELTNAHWEGLFQSVDGLLIQILPANMSPLYEDAVRMARIFRSGSVRIRAASPEHLIVMGLVAFRPNKDLVRIPLLLEHADRRRLRSLVRRFDDVEGTLSKRFAQFTGRGHRQ